jgi:hypothetical protein
MICFVAARNRAQFDAWVNSFINDDNVEYRYVEGPHTFTHDNFNSDYDDLRHLDGWALNQDYSVQFVHKLSNVRCYW